MRFDICLVAIAFAVVLAAWVSDRARFREPIGAHTVRIYVQAREVESFGSWRECDARAQALAHEADGIGVPFIVSCSKDVVK